jgi:cysteine-rich repeat protein
MYQFMIALCFLSVGCSEVCGDGALESGEACDDGNTLNADGCEANCSLPACNNGIVDPGEVCFFNPTLFETDETPVDIVVADFNRDGALDLVTANSGGLSLSVLLGDGAGGFARASDIDLVQFTSFVAVGDFDGDGILDLAASLSQLDRIEVFRGVGDGSFDPLVTIPVIDPDSLVIADLNGDKLLDLVSTSGTGVAVLLNNGAGNFLASRFSDAVSLVVGLASGDFNGDGEIDLVVTHGFVEDAFRVLLGDGAGNFLVQAPQPSGEAGDILTDDFNNDGILDLAVGSFLASEISVFTGDDLGIFSEAQTIDIRSPSALAAGDINSDGVLDLAVSSGLDQKNTAHLAVSLGDGAGSFALPLLFSTGFSGLSGLVLADLNEDGALDAVLTDQSFGRVFVFLSEP